MGNIRKLDAVKKLCGTLRADRALQPVGVPVLLEAPGWLDEDARACWGEIAPILFRHGVTTVLDHHALLRYVSAEIQRRRAEQAGHHAQAQKYGRLASTLGDALGLSPAARVKVPVKPPAQTEAAGLAKLLDL